MNCCDYNCHQGRDCPARVAKVKQRIPGAEPLPDGRWRAHLKTAAKGLLAAMIVLVVSCSWLLLITATAGFTPGRRVVDCSMASFHPDFTPAMREACRKRPKS